MTLAQLTKRHRDEIQRIALRHGVTNVRVFGSTVRGETHAKSDVDVLVDLEPGRTLIDLGAMQMDLQDLLGCRVDVVTEPALHWSIRDRVVQEAVPL